MNRRNASNLQENLPLGRRDEVAPEPVNVATVRVGKDLSVEAEALDEEAIERLAASCTHANKAHDRAVKAGYYGGNVRPSVETWEESGVFVRVARGATSKLVEALGAEPVWIDETETAPVAWPAYRGELRGYQDRAASIAAAARQGVVVGGCGSGKTEILLAASARSGQRTLVLVDTRDLQAQWIGRVLERYAVEPGDVGAVGGVESDPRGADWRLVNRGTGGRVVTVATVQTVLRRPEEAEGYGCVVGDEAHVWAARTFLEVVAPTRAAWRLGATATLQRSDGLIGVVLDVFGPVLYEVSDEELGDAGVLQEATVRLVRTPFRMDARPRRRGRIWVHVPWNEVVDAMVRDGGRHRIAVSTCLRAAREGPALVLSIRRPYAVEIGAALAAEGVRVASLFGGQGRASDCLGCGRFPEVEGDETRCAGCGAPLLRRGEHNAAVLAAVEAGTVRVVVATSVADKGLDAPSVSRAVVVLPTAGATGEAVSSRLRQQLGRLRRVSEGKADSVLYYLSDEEMRFGRERAGKLRRRFGAVND